MTTKITNDNIADNSITVDKLAPSTVASLYTAGDGITIEANGRISAVSVGPTITGFTVQGTDDLALDPTGGQTVVIQGTRFQEGATVQVGANIISVVTFIDSTTLQFTSEALSSGLYNLYVINPDNSIAALSPGLPYSGFPTFVTESGSLGTYYETTQISETIEAAEANDTITYAVVSGQLPPGSNLLANGTIIGSAPIESASNTYSFTIAATDEENQSTTRSFNLTINADVVTWVSPAEGATIEIDGNTLMSNVLLSATSAAGYDIVYTANTLPENVFLSGNVVYGTPNTDQTISTVFTATANTSNRSATRTVNWSVVFDDVYFNQTTLLLNGDENTFITDASDNAFTITPAADTRPMAFSPYNTAWSNYFDGDGDYLTAPAGDPLTLGTGDFTIEFWVYSDELTTSTVDPNFIDFRPASTNGIYPSIFYDASESNLVFYVNAVNRIDGGALSENTWYHIAVARSGTDTKMFVNGTQVGSTYTDTNNYLCGASRPSIGAQGFNITNVDRQLRGYLSNVRVIKGTALYTSDFTPPTAPLTAISGTSLLTCQSNRLIDNSTNALAITRTGDVKAISFGPFTDTDTTTGSGYFDGTGDYLTVNSFNGSLGSGDYTIEFWFNTSDTNNYEFFAPTVAFAAPAIIGISGTTLSVQYRYGDGTGFSWTGASIVHDNCWHHLALTRSGTSVKLYVDGILRGQGTNSPATDYSGVTTNWTLGYGNQGAGRIYQGYLSNFRVVAGTAVYTGGTNTGDVVFTPPTSPLTSVSGTQLLTLQNRIGYNNSQPIDESGIKNVITRNGNASAGSFSPHVPTGWSAYFDGTGDYVAIDQGSVALENWYSEDYSIEMWVYPIVHAQSSPNAIGLYISNGTYNAATTYWGLGTASTGHLKWYYYNGVGQSLTASTNPLSLNAWSHVSLIYTHSTGAIKGYVNGVEVFSGTKSGTPQSGNAYDINIGVSQGIYYNGYISNLRIVKGTAVYTAAFTPPTEPLEPIANTSLLTLRSNSFVDEGSNRFAITRNGDTKITPFSPFKPHTVAPDSYSVYFDGTEDYLTGATGDSTLNTALDILGGDYTIEFWMYKTVNTNQSLATNFTASGANGWEVRVREDGAVAINHWVNNSALSVTSLFGQYALNQWNHIAIVKNSGNYYFYVNGVDAGIFQNGSRAAPANGGAGTGLGIGTYIQNLGFPASFNGYLSNLRIVKGTAVYTAAFTPPTAPLTAISGTSLLTCQSPTVIDNSTNAFAITVNGNSQPTKFNPFGETATTGVEYSPASHGGSVYFDGTSDYLTVAGTDAFAFGTGDFTVECWALQPNINAGTRIIASSTPFGSGNTGWALYFGAGFVAWLVDNANRIVSSSAINPGTWNHISIVRSSGSTKMYINGVQTGSTYSDSTNYSGTAQYIGGDPTQNYFGYISNFRAIKGTALYTSAFVPPQAPPTPIPGTTLLLNGTNAVIQDKTGRNVLETAGNARVVNGVKKYGTGSMSFDGTGDYLNCTNANRQFDFGTGDFTIEFWVYVNSLAAYSFLIDTRTSTVTTGVWLIDIGTNGVIGWGPASSIAISSSAVSTGQWYHVAVTRSGTSTKMFLNGQQTGSTHTNSASIVAGGLTIGGSGLNPGSFTFNGYIDDLRITKGVARYTADFSPPTGTYRLK